MKVVLFCGGLGMRLKEYSEIIPKPMINIGYRPILWHVMKYYAHFGHKDFILCLGHRGDVIKNYFLNYNEAVSNDFPHQRRREIASPRLHPRWKITFVDTGSTRTSDALKAVQSTSGRMLATTPTACQLPLRLIGTEGQKTGIFVSAALLHLPS
jgi:glucose-1-phosphate cytidylyltransferase